MTLLGKPVILKIDTLATNSIACQCRLLKFLTTVIQLYGVLIKGKPAMGIWKLCIMLQLFCESKIIP